MFRVECVLDQPRHFRFDFCKLHKIRNSYSTRSSVCSWQMKALAQALDLSCDYFVVFFSRESLYFVLNAYFETLISFIFLYSPYSNIMFNAKVPQPSLARKDQSSYL